MTRDMDLIRTILIEVEKLPPFQAWPSRELDGHGKEEVIAHIQLAQEAGLVEAKILPGVDAVILRITNSGYDFLEASKQPTLWEQAKGLVISNGLPMTIATVKTVLQTLVNDALAKLH